MKRPTELPEVCPFCEGTEYRDTSIDGRNPVRVFECNMQWNPKHGTWSFFHVNVYGKADTAAAHFKVQAERAGLAFAEL